MQRSQGPQTPYEVYCHNCHTSFAAGTRKCVHCGNRIGSVRRGPAGGLIPIPGTADPESARQSDPYEEGEVEEEGLGSSLARRLGGLGIWILLALGATLMRMCEGSGG